MEKTINVKTDMRVKELLKVLLYICIIVNFHSCTNGIYENRSADSIILMDENGDSLNIQVKGPMDNNSLNEILNIEVDSFVYSTKNLYSINIKNYLNDNILVFHFEQKQVYEDSTFVYTTLRKGEKYRRWYKSWRNPVKSRYSNMKTDTLGYGDQGNYWFYLDYLEEGDSVMIYNTFETTDTSKFIVQFGGVIQNGSLNLLNYENEDK